MSETATVELQPDPSPYSYERIGQLATQLTDSVEAGGPPDAFAMNLGDLDFSCIANAVRAYGVGIQEPGRGHEFHTFVQRDTEADSRFSAAFEPTRGIGAGNQGHNYIKLQQTTGRSNSRTELAVTLPITSGGRLRRGGALTKGLRVTSIEPGGSIKRITDPSMSGAAVASLVHLLGTRIEERALQLQQESAA